MRSTLSLAMRRLSLTIEQAFVFLSAERDSCQAVCRARRLRRRRTQDLFRRPRVQCSPGGFEPAGETADRRVLQKVAHVEAIPGVAQPVDDLDRLDRIAADFKKTIIRTEAVSAQDCAPNLGDLLL